MGMHPQASDLVHTHNRLLSKTPATLPCTQPSQGHERTHAQATPHQGTSQGAAPGTLYTAASTSRLPSPLHLLRSPRAHRAAIAAAASASAAAATGAAVRARNPAGASLDRPAAASSDATVARRSAILAASSGVRPSCSRGNVHAVT